jgi:capsular polysaccharide biosynthesis protein
MPETIFYLEGRGGKYLYHFILLNLGGLYYILNKNYNVRGEPNTSVLLEDTYKVVSIPSNPITFPIKIYMKDIIPFQREAFEIIKDKFELIEVLPQHSDYEIVSIYGELTADNSSLHICNNATNIYPFIRDLFIEKLNYNIIPKKRIFITRKNSECQHNGHLKRIIINESQVIDSLKKYNFEYIQLEDYTTYEKIKLFMESELIISSHSGGLVFSLFANKNAKIIEILNNGTSEFTHRHYIDICNTLGLNYNRYSNITEDMNGNFELNITKFEEYLINHINIYNR